MKIFVTGFVAICSIAAVAQQPWQKIQMPTAVQVEQTWKAPPPEYGPEPYYGFNGPMDETVMRRDLDRIKALGFRAVTMQAYDEPAFVEDIAREVVLSLRADPRCAAWSVSVVNQESIHDHQAVARVSG